MTQTLAIGEQIVEQRQCLTYEELSRLSVQQTEQKVESFVGELRKMTPEERISASRYTMNRWEYCVYAAHFPDEVPTVNGELERIALPSNSRLAPRGLGGAAATSTSVASEAAACAPTST